MARVALRVPQGSSCCARALFVLSGVACKTVLARPSCGGRRTADNALRVLLRLFVANVGAARSLARSLAAWYPLAGIVVAAVLWIWGQN